MDCFTPPGTRVVIDKEFHGRFTVGLKITEKIVIKNFKCRHRNKNEKEAINGQKRGCHRQDFLKFNSFWPHLHMCRSSFHLEPRSDGSLNQPILDESANVFGKMSEKKPQQHKRPLHAGLITAILRTLFAADSFPRSMMECSGWKKKGPGFNPLSDMNDGHLFSLHHNF